MNTRRILIFLLLLSLALTSALPARATETDDLIRQILIYYSHHQENAETDILQLLEQLEQLDPEAAADWKTILKTWRWAVEDLEVNWEVLPDGLPQDDSLCILVMGFQLGYGGAMTQELIQRLEVALASAEKYPNALIVCTGGGTAPGNPYVTEAGQMAQWLRENGVAPERIIVEGHSFSTEENVMRSFDILRRDYPQISSLALISSDYHLRRCHLLFTAGIVLQDMPYTIAGDACFEAGYEGTNEGYFEEAKSLGNMLNLYVANTRCPELSQLTGISVHGATNYSAGESLNLTVTAEYDSGFTRDVTQVAEISGFDTTVDGQQELTIRYQENDIARECTFRVTVMPLPSTIPVTEPPTTVPATTMPPEKNSAQATVIPTSVLTVALTCGVSAMLLFLFLVSPRRGKYAKRRRK